MAKIFIGMETSGQLRRRFTAAGHAVISCDLLPSEDDAPTHVVGDVFETLNRLASIGWVPDAGVFHPECTYHTVSAAWAFKDPDFVRYPGVGYHQRVKTGTLVGPERREAREKAENDFERIRKFPFLKIVENPVGTIPTRLGHKPADTVQPYQFGDDASKATCIWCFDADGNAVPFNLARTEQVAPTVRPNGKLRWANQSDNGQNRLGPSDDRWSERSRTYDGIADAIVAAVLETLTA